MISTQTLTSRAAFAGLESEWNALLQSSASNTITLTHQWQSTWWDTFGENRELHLIAARENGELVGIAPLLKRRARRYGVPVSRIEFIASGEAEADEICSDYLDFICQIGREREVLGAIFAALQADKSWDELLLTDISGHSPNLELAREFCGARGWNYEIAREQTCIWVPLPGSREALLSSISSQKRKRLQKDRRTVAELEMRVEKCDSVENWQAGFETMVALHQERWNSRGMPGSFASPRFSAFHRALAPQMAAKGWLRLWILHTAQAPLCAVYDFNYGGKISHYQSGLGTLETPLLQPGMLIRDYALEAGIAEGLTECDFLKGEIGGYKMSWGGQTRPILQIRIARGGVKTALIQSLHRLAEKIRPLRRRWLNRLKKGREAASKVKKETPGGAVSPDTGQ